MSFNKDKYKLWSDRTRELISRYRGALLVLLSQVLSAIVNAGVKTLVTQHQNRVHPVQILNTRMIITLFLGFWYCWYRDVPHHPFGPKDIRHLMILRAIGGSCGALAFYYSLEYLPLGEATILNLLAPLGSCCFMALLTPGSFSKTHAIAAVASLCSVVLIANPSMLFRSEAVGNIEVRRAVTSRAGPTTSVYEIEKEHGRWIAGVMFALLGAGGGACAYSCIRLIGRHVHPLLSVNYFAFSVMITTSIALLIPSLHFNLYYSFNEVIMLLLLSIISFSTEFIMTTGLAVEKSSSATQMIFSQVLFATLIDWFVWRIVPSPSTVAGGLLLTSSISIVLLTQI